MGAWVLIIEFWYNPALFDAPAVERRRVMTSRDVGAIPRMPARRCAAGTGPAIRLTE